MLSTSHADRAKEFLVNHKDRVDWHNNTLWGMRSKRDNMAHTLPEWEYLRELSDNIKLHTLSHLGDYLEQFVKNCEANGVKVHFAKDAKEHNEIVYSILKQNNITEGIIKSKSMLTEECGLNHFLEEKGMEVIDSDLGERIIQLRHETPSHIVVPAIHIKRQELSGLFHKTFNSDLNNDDPTYMTNEVRNHLRPYFENAKAGITGVNFAIAETGGIVICTNEGNADLVTSIPKLHIACMGVEKLIPSLQSLSVYTRLLARSATGQPITTYTSHIHKSVKNGEMHIVILDNKRSDLLSNKDFINSLKCIRCGACMNTCPVYRRSGGHSYSYVIPGPIGSVLGGFKDPKENSTLPFACSMCASCANVCPARINLDELLLKARAIVSETGNLPLFKKLSTPFVYIVFSNNFILNSVMLLAKIALKIIPKSWLNYNPLNSYSSAGRDLPKLPWKNFKQIYKEKYEKK